MRWLPFAILLYVTTVLQTAFAPFIAIHTVRPDLMLILAVYYAMHARRYDALIACWIIGLVTDLAGTSYTEQGYSNIGVSAMAFGIIGLIVVSMRELAFRESAATQLITTFLAKLALNLMVGSHMLYVLDDWGRFPGVFTVAFWHAVYTAGLALYGYWILRQMRFMLGVGLADTLRAR
ncbi:MAG: rod shape-determining protein MreD [Phycisphaerae bacterium]|nr:rod shape-determining protein MreD [Phycisphaerae bacterium]